MYCPACGLTQVADEVRFCPRCGFALGLVAELVANNGVLPAHLAPAGVVQGESPRRKGLRQGGAVMLFGAFLVPVIALLTVIAGLDTETILLGVVVLILGLMRLLYALLFQDNRPTVRADAGSLPHNLIQSAVNLVSPASARASLPEARPAAATSFRRRYTA